MSGAHAAQVSMGQVRTVTTFAACMAAAIAAFVPATYYWANMQREVAEVTAEARSIASSVSDLATRNPDYWRYEVHRVEGLLRLGENPQHPELRQAFDTKELVATRGEAKVGPQIEGVAPIFDAGQQVGRVVVVRSQDALMLSTAQAGIFSLVLAVLAFVSMRILPLRMLAQATSRAAHLATHDTLTGLPNRALFLDRLEQGLARARRNRHSVAILSFDLDRFKEVNDTLGHAAGDRLLALVAERVRGCIRESDTLARLGGDEFAIIQCNAPQPVQAEALAQRLLDLLAEPFDLGGHQAVIGASFGITLRLEVGSEAGAVASLMQEADLALYQVKQEGRCGYRFYAADMHRKLLARRHLQADIDRALAEGQFRLALQPQVEISSGEVTGAEALLRWHHPERGEVAPADFVQLAEETGQIVAIGDWVLRQACQHAVLWPRPLRIAVNVSSVQFQRGDLYASVETALAESGLAPERLEIEITEGVLLEDCPQTITLLNRLHMLGVRIAMDDFGTGYSSLSYLQRFPFDKVKIDRSFIQRLEAEPNATAIVRAVIGPGHALGVKTNAEGVETQAQADILQREGCAEIQGYLHGRPTNADAFLAMLHSQASPRLLRAL